MDPKDQEECLGFMLDTLKIKNPSIEELQKEYGPDREEKQEIKKPQNEKTENRKQEKIILTLEEQKMLDNLLFFYVQDVDEKRVKEAYEKKEKEKEKESEINTEVVNEKLRLIRLQLAESKLIHDLEQQRKKMKAYDDNAQEEDTIISSDPDLARAASSTKYVQNYYKSKTELPDQKLVNSVRANLPDGVSDVIARILLGKESVLVIFNGISGTGKTTLAKVITKISLKDFRFNKVPAMKNNYKSDILVNQINSIAPIIEANEPYVIILDEINNLIQNTHLPSEKRQVEEQDSIKLFIELLDDCLKRPAITILATTNNVDLLPDVVKLRFQVIDIPKLNKERALLALKYQLDQAIMKVNKLCLEKNLLDKIATRFGYCTAREIKDFVSAAQNHARNRPKTSYESMPQQYSSERTNNIINELEKKGFESEITKGAIYVLYTIKMNTLESELLPCDLEAILSQKYPHVTRWFFRTSTWTGLGNSGWKLTKKFAKERGPEIIKDITTQVIGLLINRAITYGERKLQERATLQQIEHAPIHLDLAKQSAETAKKGVKVSEAALNESKEGNRIGSENLKLSERNTENSNKSLKLQAEGNEINKSALATSQKGVGISEQSLDETKKGTEIAKKQHELNYDQFYVGLTTKDINVNLSGNAGLSKEGVNGNVGVGVSGAIPTNRRIKKIMEKKYMPKEVKEDKDGWCSIL